MKYCYKWGILFVDKRLWYNHGYAELKEHDSKTTSQMWGMYKKEKKYILFN